MEEVAAIAMTVNGFKTRHLFNHKFRPQAEKAPVAAAPPEAPAPAPGRT
jgi:hypothetical protein